MQIVSRNRMESIPAKIDINIEKCSGTSVKQKVKITYELQLYVKIWITCLYIRKKTGK